MFRYRVLSVLVLWTFVGVLVIGCRPVQETPVTAQPSFAYEVQVRDLETDQVIPNATVIVTAVDSPPEPLERTDENGKATIELDFMKMNGMVQLTVMAEGYQKSEQYYNLNEDSLPKVVYLQPDPKMQTNTAPLITPTGAGESPIEPETPEEPATSTPTTSPTATPSPTVAPPPTVAPTQNAAPPQPAPTSPLVSPLQIRDLWETNVGCGAGFWYAELWVKPVGGNGIYKYYVDGDLLAGPLQEGTTIRLTRNNCTALVGTMTVQSGNQVQSEKFYVAVPECCH